MNRAQNIAVVTIGYNTQYAFIDAAAALELMALMSKAVAVTDQAYRMGEQPHSHFLADDPTMPELKFVPAHKFNPHETVTEAKERLEREKRDREDIDQRMSEAPTALPAPTVSAADDDLAFF